MYIICDRTRQNQALLAISVIALQAVRSEFGWNYENYFFCKKR